MVGYRTATWLSHHRPEQYFRCMHIGRWRICRRCVALGVPILCLPPFFYPPKVLPAWIISIWPAMVLPALVDLVLDQRRTVRYSPLRLWLGNLLAGTGIAIVIYKMMLGRLDRWDAACAFLVLAPTYPRLLEQALVHEGNRQAMKTGAKSGSVVSENREEGNACRTAQDAVPA